MPVIKIINSLNRVVNFFGQAYALWFLYHHMPSPPPEKDFAGIWKFFTIWTVTAHMIFFGMCILCEVFSYLKFKTDNFSFRGLLFHAAVFPMGVSVFISFWLLYFSDRELISPKRLDGIIPAYINQIIHTLILPGVIIESLTYFHPLPKRKDSLVLTTIIQLSYAGLVFYMGYTRDNWVYPFMGLLPMPLRFAFVIVTFFINTGYFLLGEKLHKLFWRKHMKEL
jgi:hypothetical protein